MIWQLSNRAAPRSRRIADRHYNRQHVGAEQFVPPGRCLVLHAVTPTGSALWITSWPFAEYAKHEWAGAWMCSLFRNEGAGVASDLIRQAIAATRAHYGDPPSQGMVTFLDRRRVRPIMRRGKPTWGRTWKLVGFDEVGETKAERLLALQLLPHAMPEPEFAVNAQPSLGLVA